jgi:serine O-acetyltransferase
VTLGGTSLDPGKRHPTLEEHVVVGSGAKILGNITIGHHARVGSGSVVIKSAPPRSTLVGIPARVLEERPADETGPGHELDHGHMPDATAKAITALHEQLRSLAREVAELRHEPVTATLPKGLTTEEVEQAFRAIHASAEDAPARAPDVSEGAGI